mgnify:CR=1 FL=1|jgi:hypothetical protein
MNKQELNQKIWITERLLVLVRKTPDLQIPDEQTELIDYLEEQRSKYRSGLREKLLGRA